MFINKILYHHVAECDNYVMNTKHMKHVNIGIIYLQFESCTHLVHYVYVSFLVEVWGLLLMVCLHIQKFLIDFLNNIITHCYLNFNEQRLAFSHYKLNFQHFLAAKQVLILFFWGFIETYHCKYHEYVDLYGTCYDNGILYGNPQLKPATVGSIHG